MIGVVFGVGLLLALLAKASSAHASSAPDVSASLHKIVSSGDPAKMLAAGQAAHAAGDRQLGTALTERARNAAAASPTAVYPSPFPSVPTPAWSAWVHAMRAGTKPDTITPGYFLGMFGLGMQRAVDLGLAENPRQIVRNGRKVWDADWLAPLQPGPQKFLSMPAFQYATFRRAVAADLAAIGSQMPQAVGTEIDGVKATPSGLLAVAKLAGVHGLKAWLEDPAVRAKFPQSSALFHKVNGIF